jgi:fluoride ion exporter CrcB/FEX
MTLLQTDAASNPATPETAVFILAGLVGVAALYFGYLTYVRGGREAETNLWLYGLVATGFLGAYAAYLTFSRIGIVASVQGTEAVAVLLVSVFLMLMFKEGAEFFE